MTRVSALPVERLRWRVADEDLSFTTTAEIDPAESVVGQSVALEAMRFGVETDAPGQNIYVRGVTGTGRMTLARSLLEQLEPEPRRRLDRAYVHHFRQPEQPRLVTLPAGDGPRFRRAMKDIAAFIAEELHEALKSPPLRERREAIQEKTQKAVNEVTGPLEKELREAGLALVRQQAGAVTRTVIYPVHDGEPVPPDKYRLLAQKGEVSSEDLERFEARIEADSKRLAEVSEEASAAYRAGVEEMQAFLESEARDLVQRATTPVRQRWRDSDGVGAFLDEVVEDAVENRLDPEAAKKQPPAEMVYGVNVVRTRPPGEACPVVVENSPTVQNLVGAVEPEFVGRGQAIRNYRGVRAGALVQADGGYLVLDARDLLAEPGAWRSLMRALRTSRVDIAGNDHGWPFASATLKPEPIDINVRVILLGSGSLFHQLDLVDQDFANLFKVLVDFRSEIDRGDEALSHYAGVVARLAADENLPPFDNSGVAALVEHGARIAAREGKVTARFGRIADIAREAAFLARNDGRETVSRDDVEETVRRTKFRASLPSQRFQELVRDGVLRVDVDGGVVGQVNGMAVMRAGPLTYGFPSRITATIGAGRAGIIDIEAAASMSGSIHTKGFQILGGCLRHLLRAEHPLAFSASIAFEQSYGGIDGDSASGAEICCLISALTGVPIRQSLAMTGAIDQHGALQAIGGVNEKIEGFFDTCQVRGLTGEQGVIIPLSNAGDLMLREDVVAACAAGEFAVYACGHVAEALEVLTGEASGWPSTDGRYPADSLLERARQQVRSYWEKSMARPGVGDG